MNFDSNKKKQIFIVQAALLITIIASEEGQTQIIPDRTLPVNSIAVPNINTTEIKGGTQRGRNLFHSFEQFSLPQGEAFFNNARSIENIFSRVTGNLPSNINGLIRANGTANLYFLNPNGILFGPNARLDIGGSFIGTTADRILFADGFEFNAKNPSTSPLLTVSVPVGLGFAENSGNISVRGTGHNLFYANPSAMTNSPILGFGQSVTGLRTTPQKTLALIGGQVEIDGGLLTAPSGRIEVGSVRKGTVNLIPSPLGVSFSYDKVNSFQDIQLTQDALLDASGNFDGTINLQGRNLAFNDGALAIISNTGSFSSSEININATESITFTGIASLNNFNAQSIIRGVYTQNFSSGKGADIVISARNLTLQDFSFISAYTFGQGDGGNINLNVQNTIKIDGTPPIESLFLPSSIATVSLGAGTAGNVSLVGKSLYVQDGGLLISQTLRDGNGGNIKIETSELVKISGSFPVDLATNSFISSSIGTNTVSLGTAGNVFISTRFLKVTDGGRINATTVATGNAGNIEIDASDSIEVSGVIPNTNSQLSINVSQIFAEADRPNPFLAQIFDLPEIPSGDSGGIRLSTNKLIIQDAGQISVINDGTGNAGTLEINAPSLFLDNAGSISATTASGQGGDIFVNSSDLRLNDNSSISATAGGTGDGGNITINTDTLTALENSNITANAFKGRGGNINITTRGIFLSPDSSITATSELGVDGTVSIEILQPVQQEPIAQTPTITTGQLLATSCLNRTNARGRGTFNYIGQSGLPLLPDSGFDSQGEAVKIPKPSQSISVRHEDSPVARSKRPWQIGDPVVEPNQEVKTPDGRVLFVNTSVSETPLSIEELICQPTSTQSGK